MAARKGHTPLKMVQISTSLSTVLTMKTFIPMGGVISPISTTMMITMPNQIGSTPSESTIGKNTGTVSSSMARLSKTQPSTT